MPEFDRRIWSCPECGCSNADFGQSYCLICQEEILEEDRVYMED